MVQQHGILVIDKPAGLSSAQCAGRIKKLGQRKIGHAGTLDPMATGVLVLLLGQATKISGYLLAGGDKTYLAAIRLGQITDTWDALGTVLEERAWRQVREEAVCDGIAAWRGAVRQRVPPYSAAKHQGRPLYKLARAGCDIPVKMKDVHISRAEVTRVELPLVEARIVCSSGTYIRSLAHSLGMRLGCGAVLAGLVREYSHPFALEQAWRLDDILDAPDTLPERVLPLQAGLPGWPVLTLDAVQEQAVRAGIGFAASRPAGVKAVLADLHGRPLALAEAQAGNWRILRGLWF